MNYIIIGSGPTGLFLSYLLSKKGYKCLVLDRDSEIGGCHKVRRVNNYFTEHGPRIYMNNYVNYINLLNDMNINFYNEYKPYKYNFPVGIKDALKLLSLNNIFVLIFNYFYYIINPKYYENISVEDFLNKYNFNKKSKEYFDKICKLTDGAGIDRYTIYELFGLINNSFFYKIYEPIEPNDLGIMNKIKNKLNELNIKFIKFNVKNFELNNNNNINKIISYNNHVINVNNNTKIIMAIPPYNILEILTNSNNKIKNCFMEYNLFKKYVFDTNYIPYISFSIIWNKEIKIKDIWGNGFGDFGIIWINMTDYFNNKSKTILSCSIIELNTISKNLGLTANQINDKKILLREAFSEINEILKIKEYPDQLILSPAVYRDNNLGEWKTKDTAYIKTKNSIKFPFNTKIKNLYNCGCHNEKSDYPFTSMESAVINSIELVNYLKIDNEKNIDIIKNYTLNNFIKLILILIIIISLSKKKIYL